MPLTSLQYDRLHAERIVNRIASRKMYQLAFHLCQFLKLKDETVLVTWACEKAATSTQTDAEIHEAIKRKLGGKRGVDFSEIVNAAVEAKRKRLAIMLLGLETRVEGTSKLWLAPFPPPSRTLFRASILTDVFICTDQVLLLVGMHEINLALQKAIRSSDCDLIYRVIVASERLPPNSHSHQVQLVAIPLCTNWQSIERTLFARNSLRHLQKL